MVGGVLLAAGAATRFGGDKQLTFFEGKTLLRRAAEALNAAAIGPSVVVLGPDPDRGGRHRRELAGLALASIVNNDAATGMASSLIAGLVYLQTHYLSGDLEAMLVMVCDQPFCTAAHLRALVDTWRQTGRPIAASRYAGVLGVPALFDAAMFGPLQRLSGNRGAAHLIREREQEVAALDFPAGAIDIDTQQDLQRLERGSTG